MMMMVPGVGGTFQWFINLFSQTESVAHAALILAIVAAVGLVIGSIRFWGISLGIAGVLFSGLLVGHIYGRFELSSINREVLHFVQEFGLILFVYTIGVQVGPGFLASLRRQGLALNIMAAAIVVMGVAITVGIYKFSDVVPLPAAVGLFSGGTTNTPSLAAAQEALRQLNQPPEVVGMPTIAYAVAYPFGIVGIIVTMLLVRAVFRIDPKDENELFVRMQGSDRPQLSTMNIEVNNSNLEGVPLSRIPTMADGGVVVSRVLFGGIPMAPRPEMKVRVGGILHVVGTQEKLEQLKLVLGRESATDLKRVPSQIITRKILVTKSRALGRTVDELGLDARYGVNITRINRGDVELSATRRTPLQFGDTLLAVGDEESIRQVADELGDSVKKLNHPQVIPVFVGIILGVLLGSWAIPVPGLPEPVKLGLAGGPLVAAIILSRIGHIGPVVWYMPQSANFILREVGIVLFLACVGLNSGDRFWATLSEGDGLVWMAYGCLITIIPLLLVAFIGRAVMKINFLTLCGVLAGSMTDPPALAFANQVAASDAPSVSYATVYPMTMLLRVLAAQAMILLLMH